MNNRLLLPQNVERHLKLWIYLLPIVGVIPAVWTLYRQSKKPIDEYREQKKASLLSIKLVLVWLISYASCSFGAASASEIMSFRLLYANAIITTAYFVTCTVLMASLVNKSKG